MLRIWVIVGALALPVVLGAAFADRFGPHPALAGSLVYLTSSHICHQRPERSFAANGVTLPVCARCTGLYVGGALGAVLAMRRRRRQPIPVMALVVAAAPTAATWLIEFAGGVAVGNVARAVSALPLGACLVLVLATVADRRPEAIG